MPILPASPRTPEEILFNRLPDGLSDELTRAMNCLSEDHRQIILLFAIGGYRFKEIATLLDIKIGTVMSRISRAREALKKALEGIGGFSP